MYETPYGIYIHGSLWHKFLVPHDRLEHPGKVNSRAAQIAARIVGDHGPSKYKVCRIPQA